MASTNSCYVYLSCVNVLHSIDHFKRSYKMCTLRVHRIHNNDHSYGLLRNIIIVCLRQNNNNRIKSNAQIKATIKHSSCWMRCDVFACGEGSILLYNCFCLDSIPSSPSVVYNYDALTLLFFCSHCSLCIVWFSKITLFSDFGTKFCCMPIPFHIHLFFCFCFCFYCCCVQLKFSF